MRRAIADVPSPSAAARTILARSANPARTDDDRVHDTNVARSSSEISTNPVDATTHHGTYDPLCKGTNAARY